MITERIVIWAAQECAWQQSGELSVAWMIKGWQFAHRLHPATILGLQDILELGRIVEPRQNQNGLRQVNVRVGWDNKMPWQNVPAALDGLLAMKPEGEDEIIEWFRVYEEIHPFRDGNGRTGSILYNWLRGSLREPIHPPNLWNDPRRNYEGYPMPKLVKRWSND